MWTTNEAIGESEKTSDVYEGESDAQDTGVVAGDTDLKGANSFEVAKYPTMTFKSTSVKSAGSYYVVNWDVTLHGVATGTNE